MTRAEQRRRNRAALLRAAAEVFAARGFPGATIDDVAAAAGLTKGAVYSHFGSKHELFAAAIEQRYAERLEAFRALVGGPGAPEERTAAAAEFARSVTADADWALLLLEAWAEGLRTPAFGDRLRAAADALRDAVAELLDGQLAVLAPGHPADRTRLAEAVLAMSHGFGIAHRLDPGHAPQGLFTEMMGWFVTGVLAQAAGQPGDEGRNGEDGLAD